MTWLPVTVADETPDYEAVFGLLPDQWQNLQELYRSVWAMTNRDLLELCWLRMAQTLESRGPLGADQALLDDLAEWWNRDRFTPLERAALNYVDYFLLDCNAVTVEMNEELERQIGSLRELYQFVAAMNTVELLLRTCILLDLDPLLPRGERVVATGEAPDEYPPPDADGIGLREWYRQVIDKRFSNARAIYGASVVRLAEVDALTTESVRLRNASFQQCRY